ncbi:mannose-6-phosphate isomerase [Pasteurellaceae bacterium LFhippo2]|nr:mannose-6-phosphate isomerase [Pasteurellaceae bacterium LFhippo2]
MIFKLKGTFQHYDWGGESFIPNWLKLKETEDKPYAEYWLGAHRLAPSLIEFEGQWLELDRVLDKAPKLLGEKSQGKFGDELPFLLKILDVKSPISIQIHPTAAEAKLGYEQEDEMGIPLTAYNRVYKDHNHKAEMMIALSDFWLLHGFRTEANIVETLRERESLKQLANHIERRSLASVYAEIMQADQSQLAEWLLPIIHSKREDYQQGKLKLDDPDYWVLFSMDSLQISEDKLDAGLVCFYLFNIVHLEKGESVYQGAGFPHAYLRGQSIELMANSDNIIRGGLTKKYVNIPALLNTIDYREITPKIIPAYEGDEPLYLYPTSEIDDFVMQRFEFKPFDEEKFTATSATILLVMSGSLYIDLGDDSIYLQQGEAAFISADSEVDIIGETDGYAVIATLPCE